MPIKGTMSVADNHAMTKMLRSTKFPESFSTRVTLSKVNVPVLSQWVEEKINSILGFEDEIVSSMAINLFLPTAAEDAPAQIVDPRRAQLDLVGFLGEEEAATFAGELWSLMVDAQSTSTGIPSKLLEQKKRELAQKKKTSIPPAPARPRDPGMDRYLQQASQRAERAREAIAANPGLVRNANEAVAAPAVPAAAALVEMRPRSVSPPRVKQGTPMQQQPDDERRGEGSKKQESLRYSERDDDESSQSGSEDSRSVDSEEERRWRRNRERRRRYDDEEEDRRYYRQDRDRGDRRYHDRDYDRHRPRRDDDRDSFGRRRRSRSRSYERDRRRYRSERRSRSYSSESD